MSPGAYRNIHGRRWGRGARPWLLMLKIVGVGVFLGGLVSVLVVQLATPTPDTPQGWVLQAALIRRAFVLVIVPGLVTALCAGSMLAVTLLGVFLRVRWFQAKLLVVAAAAPALHVFMRGRSAALRAALDSPPDLEAACRIRSQLLAGTVAAIAFTLVVMWLGRVKPRLGQDYARALSPNGRLEPDKPPAPGPANAGWP